MNWERRLAKFFHTGAILMIYDDFAFCAVFAEFGFVLQHNQLNSKIHGWQRGKNMEHHPLALGCHEIFEASSKRMAVAGSSKPVKAECRTQ